MSDSSEEKIYDPSNKKLMKLRREGQLPRSQDFTSGFSLLALLGYFLVARDSIYSRLQVLMGTMPITQPESFRERLVIAADLTVGLGFQIIAPFIIVAFAAAIISAMIDLGGFLFTGAQLQPNFSRFNPAEGIKQIFSLRSLLELIKGLIKLTIMLVVSYLIVISHINDVFWAPTCGLPCVLGVGGVIALKIIVFGALLLLIGAVVDFAIQRMLFIQQHRMTLTEMKQERKEDSGDPHVAAQRRRIRNEMAQTAGLVGINQAAVIFLGKDMLAAVSYKPDLAGVPFVAAKGDGDKARDLLARAKANNTPIINDAMIAETIMKEGRVGDIIPKELFSPVARNLISLGLIGKS